ncbi:MFS transporter [Salirhabdus euzebyi]|nr:MFS transporter [Salirhabdus euzebyi]
MVKEATVDKWNIFIVMFLISLMMRVQVPVFTPYATMLGASSMIIGVILSVTSFTNLTGNIVAGPMVDRFGKKRFIVIPLFASAVFFVAHGFAADSNDLLLLHGLNGFALAFLIPAALALLSGYAKNSRQQGKNMAIYGILSTISAIFAPLIGGQLVVLVGYENAYFLIGAAIFAIALYTLIFLNDRQPVVIKNETKKSKKTNQTIISPTILLVYLIGFAVMYIHGVIIFEIPYLTVEQGLSTVSTGLLFSYMGLGTLLSLSLMFINRFDPLKRLLFGLFGMSLTIYALILSVFTLPILLLIVGFFFGIVMPAMGAAITNYAGQETYGRAFGYMSAVYSLGMIASSFVTGAIRDIFSPYFVAFLVGMFVTVFVGYKKLQSSQPPQHNTRLI